MCSCEGYAFSFLSLSPHIWTQGDEYTFIPFSFLSFLPNHYYSSLLSRLFRNIVFNTHTSTACTHVSNKKRRKNNLRHRLVGSICSHTQNSRSSLGVSIPRNQAIHNYGYHTLNHFLFSCSRTIPQCTRTSLSASFLDS